VHITLAASNFDRGVFQALARGFSSLWPVTNRGGIWAKRGRAGTADMGECVSTGVWLAEALLAASSRVHQSQDKATEGKLEEEATEILHREERCHSALQP
jgi:hypothetical protein